MNSSDTAIKLDGDTYRFGGLEKQLMIPSNRVPWRNHMYLTIPNHCCSISNFTFALSIHKQ